MERSAGTEVRGAHQRIGPGAPGGDRVSLGVSQGLTCQGQGDTPGGADAVPRHSSSQGRSPGEPVLGRIAELSSRGHSWT